MEQYFARFEFSGSGRELYQAIIQAHELVPRARYVDVSAIEFLEDCLNMVLGAVGLTDQKLNLSKPILGYSDISTVKLDFDDTEFRTVKYWAFRTMKGLSLKDSLF